jgi:guanylate kinase
MSRDAVSQKSTGRLFILSAPSGAGKTTLLRAVLGRFSDLCYSISHTTRPPRPGEEHGVDYFFIDKETFEAGIKNGEWLEWAKVHGHLYGTSAAFIDETLGAGKDVLLDIDVQGAKNIRRRYPDCVTIFILPPSMEELERRLRKRGAASETDIQTRLKNAEWESAQKDFFRFQIVNDDLERAKEALISLVERHRSPARAGS